MTAGATALDPHLRGWAPQHPKLPVPMKKNRFVWLLPPRLFFYISPYQLWASEMKWKQSPHFSWLLPVSRHFLKIMLRFCWYSLDKKLGINVEHQFLTKNIYLIITAHEVLTVKTGNDQQFKYHTSSNKQQTSK